MKLFMNNDHQLKKKKKLLQLAATIHFKFLFMINNQSSARPLIQIGNVIELIINWN